MKILKIIRLLVQTIALLLQVYFIVETIRLFACGYVVFLGNPVGEGWYSMLFTLLVVVACEIVSFTDVVLFVVSQPNKYSFTYMVLFFVNAICFISMAYYSTVGTVICMCLYGVLFILRVVNLVNNATNIFKKPQT